MATRQYSLTELDASSGKPTKRYVVSTTNTGKAQSNETGLRIDQIPLVPLSSQASKLPLPSSQHGTFLSFLTVYLSTALEYLKTLFLPTGYPHTVTDDYTPYQIYDSIQAFASSIAGLLSSRAVLQSLNVISSSSDTVDGTLPADSASAATAATLLSILQSTLSNLTTILFASHAAPRISSDVKFYRFLADVVNDAAFVLDLLAPALPSSFSLPMSSALPAFLTLSISPRVVVLCFSSMLRAICGVAGGSSKAVLSSHFARNNPESVGDLNAKDGSQETVVNLLGMWIGGVVVSRVDGMGATWTWMLGLLGVHLWANYRAVRRVRLRSLNKERARIMMAHVLAEWKTGTVRSDSISVDRVGNEESVLGIWKVISGIWAGCCGRRSHVLDQARCRIGVSIEEFLDGFRQSQPGNTGSTVVPGFEELLEVFSEEPYLLCWDFAKRQVLVALKNGARPVDQLKSYYHACALLHFFDEPWPSSSTDKDLASQPFEGCCAYVKETWAIRCEEFEVAGWDLAATNLDDGRSIRVKIE